MVLHWKFTKKMYTIIIKVYSKLKDVEEMNRYILKCFAITMIFVFLLPSCSDRTKTFENTPQITSVNLPQITKNDNVKINGGKTIDEAMDYYIKEIDSSKGSKGDFFTGKYKIIDTVDTSENVNVFACIVSQWVDKNGNIVFGWSGLFRVGFKKENNLYIYDNHEYYDHFESYNYPDIPQKVYDILKDNVDAIFDELNNEIDKEVENYVNSQ